MRGGGGGAPVMFMAVRGRRAPVQCSSRVLHVKRFRPPFALPACLIWLHYMWYWIKLGSILIQSLCPL